MEATASSANQLQSAQDSNGAYVLRELIRDVPLSADGEDKDVYITCVEAWGAFHCTVFATSFWNTDQPY